MRSVRVLGYMAILLCLSGLSAKAQLWGWGSNYYGELGDGTTIDRLTPVKSVSLTDVVAVATGKGFSIALKSDGTVWTWGNNAYGQLGDGTTTSRITPLPVVGLTHFVAVASGERYCLALNSDGTVYEWGNNAKQPRKVEGLTDIVAVAAGAWHSLALKSDSTVCGWGSNSYGQLGDGTTKSRSNPLPVAGLTDIVAVAAGDWHSLALKSDGTVCGWGSNSAGQLGDGSITDKYTPVPVTELTSIVAVSGGAWHSLALKSDGTVCGWGSNSYGQLGVGEGGLHNTPVSTPGLTHIKAVAACAVHSLAIDSDGKVWAWGSNREGELGDGTTEKDRSTPLPVAGLPSVGAVAGWWGRSFAITSRLKVTIHKPLGPTYPLTSETQPSILSYSRQGPDPKQQSYLLVKIKGKAGTTYKAYIQSDERSGGHEHGSSPNPPRVHGWLEKALLKEGAKYQQVYISKDPLVFNPNYKAGEVKYSDFAHGLSVKTDEDGEATLYYYAPEICGKETIYVSTTEADPVARTVASTTVTVHIPGLQPLPAEVIFNPIGGGPNFPDHPDNHYGNATLIKALTALAINYAAETGRGLPVNDMALMDGGLFDLGPDYSSQSFWKPPHIGHRRGDEADVGNAATNLLPGNATFDTILSEQGWWIINPDFWKSEGSHYHLNLAYPGGRDNYNGKVTIKATNGRRPQPLPAVAIWVDVEHTQLDLTLSLINRGGLDAQSVNITKIEFVSSAPRGATFASLATLPLDFGSMVIRATSSKTFRVLVTPGAGPLTAFTLRVTGTAASADGRTFPIPIDVIVRPR